MSTFKKFIRIASAQQVTLKAVVMTVALALAAATAMGSSHQAAADETSDVPVITGVAVTSRANWDRLENPQCDGGYGNYYRSRAHYPIGDEIEITATFDQEVVVNGSPTIDLRLSPMQRRQAKYSSNEGNTVTFSYTVQENDESKNGISIAANSIGLGATGGIKDENGIDADLRHQALPAQQWHKVDGIRPVLRSASVVLTARFWDTYIHRAMVRNTVMVEVKFSEPVTFPYELPPYIQLDIGGQTRNAVDGCLRDGYYDYIVQSGDFDDDGISIIANSFTIPTGGYIKDRAGNDAASISHAGHSAGARHLVDGRGPRYVSGTTSQDGGSITVTFDENVSIASRLRAQEYHEDIPAMPYIVDSFTVKAGGREIEIEEIKLEGRYATIKLAERIAVGRIVTIEYKNDYEPGDIDADGEIEDRFYNAVHDFGPRVVTNASRRVLEDYFIYHDPEAGAASVARYNRAVGLIDDSNRRYVIVSGDVRAVASALAGISNSVMPRFFLGDPTAEGWVSAPRVNNGGLHWLEEKLEEPEINTEETGETQQQQSNRPPEFGNVVTRDVDENSPAGTHVGTPVTATDPDGDTLTYSLSGTGSDLFAIDSASGQITVAEGTSLDHETTSYYAITVKADDGRNGSAATGLMVNVLDVDENRPPQFIYASQRDVAENSPAGTAVGAPVTATDPDGDTITYMVLGTGSELFTIDASGQIKVAAGASLDYETTPSYTITVQADDGRGFSTAINITINVTDVDENRPPVFIYAYKRGVNENSPAGTNVGNPVTATDPDGDTVTYSLSGDDAGLFTIDGNGQIKVGAGTSLDHETTPSYAITVHAADGNGGTDSVNITVNVRDVND